MENKRQFIPLGKDYLVWHYTSPNVFIKLLNNEIYATHFKFLNDDMEIAYAQKICQDFCEKEIPVVNIDSFGKKMLNQDIFVMCFSTVKDSLPQWRSYTPKSEGGFAIGFSRNKLCSALNESIIRCKRNNQQNSISWTWIKCLYSEERLHKRLQALKRLATRNTTVSSSIRQFQEGILKSSSLSAKQNLLEKSIMDLISDCNRDCTIFGAFSKMSLTYKHPTFATECEERILGVGINFENIGEGHSISNIQSWHRKDIEYIGGKPRVKIPIDSVKDCIEYVMVSPHGNKNENKLIAELFRDKYDLKFNIEMSSSPYNGR